MISSFSSSDQIRISRFVHDHIGFSYAPDRMKDLIRGFLAACQDLGIHDPDACLNLLEDPQSLSGLENALIKKLTIGETYFFRDRNLFALLRDRLLPELIKKRRGSGKYLRIWCAACSTGEEPYSIAILLHHLIPEIQDWDITIIGTDINPGSIHAAERGIYSKWSFREQAPVQIDSYISPGVDGRLHLSSEIRRMVRFFRLNLVTDLYPSVVSGTTSMDFVFCRNVLMYFSSELAASVVDRLNLSLISGGWLVVSPQEISYAQRPGFIQIQKSSVFLFQKGSGFGETIPETAISPFYSKNYPESLDYPIGIVDNHPSVTIKPDTDASDLSTLMGADWQKNEISDYHKEPSLQSSTLNNPDFPSSQHDDQTESPQSLILAGRLSEAEDLLLQNKNPDERLLNEMEIIARAFADLGDIQRALGWCDRILAIDPLRPAAYHLRAVIQQDNGEYTSAVQSLRQALYADPDYIPAHLLLGMLMGIQGRDSDSHRHYLVAHTILSAMPDDAPVEETDGMPAGRVREMVSVLLDGVKG